MPEDRIKVGFIGCGGIARSLYTGIYAALPELAQVVAVADLVDDLAENRRQVLKDAYRATAYGARAAADLARADEDKDAALHKAGAAESAAAYDIRKYRSHEELLRDSPFEEIRSGSTAATVPWTLNEVVGYLYSKSFANREVLGDRVDAFGSDLRAALIALELSGRFPRALEAVWTCARR